MTDDLFEDHSQDGFYPDDATFEVLCKEYKADTFDKTEDTADDFSEYVDAYLDGKEVLFIQYSSLSVTEDYITREAAVLYREQEEEL